MTYRKLMWEGPGGRTAGLIFDTDTLAKNPTLTSLSRFWPMSEFRKMYVLYMSPEHDAYNDAFAYVFPNTPGKKSTQEQALDYIREHDPIRAGDVPEHLYPTVLDLIADGKVHKFDRWDDNVNSIYFSLHAPLSKP